MLTFAPSLMPILIVSYGLQYLDSMSFDVATHIDTWLTNRI